MGLTHKTFSHEEVHNDHCGDHRSLVARKLVFRVSDQVQHKAGCTTTEDGYRLEILDLGRRGMVRSIHAAKSKALISCVVTAQLICAFVFAYMKSRFFS